MNEKNANFRRFSVSVLATMLLFLLSGGALRAQSSGGVPEDWSHRHLIFSNPGSDQTAIQNGVYNKWLRITNDPRYAMQKAKRSAGRKKLVDIDRVPAEVASASWGSKSGMKKDWAEGLNGGAPSVVSSPAKWSFSTTSASCADDFVVYPTGSAGGAAQASIIAYYNIYSGCTAPTPRVDFAYNTGGTIAGAPVFSTDGTQLAFIQVSGTTASLVLLRIPVTPPGTGSLGTPATPTAAASAAAYTSCSAPCMFTFTLNGSPNDTLSNPWVDYTSDSLFVGDSAGKLHKFTPVFGGTAGTPPAEITSSWPVLLDASQLASPVYDSVTGKVFVGSGAGFFYAVGGGTPQFPSLISGHVYGTSSRLGPTGQTTLIEDAAIVDSSAGTAYVFVQQDTGGNNGVFQFATSFTNGSGTEQTVGSFGQTPDPLLSGTFDNIYINSESSCTTGCTPTGNLYVGGNTASPGTLYQIPITSNVMGTPNAGPNIGGTQFFGRTSEITEFFDSGSNNVTATGTVTIATNPAFWFTPDRAVTIGSVTYTFVTGTPAASTATSVQVELNLGGLTTANEDNSATNLAAAVNASATCTNGGGAGRGCYGSGTVANAAVTATVLGNVVTLTATTSGSAGDFTLTDNGQPGIDVSGGNNGESGQDFIFLSSLTGTGRPTGCPTGGNGDGCLMNFDVTLGSTIDGTTTPVAVMTVTAALTDGVNGYPTSQIIIDNSVQSGTLAGAAEIYFLSLDSGAGACTTTGTGICATQTSQAAP